MKNLVFASANMNKVKEVSKKLGGQIPIIGLADIGCTEEIPETSSTIEGNAKQKAWYVWENYQVNCFADDTSLEVHALNNEPGVYSARYAGEHRSSSDNIDKVLKGLEDENDRSALFRTVICLVLDGKEHMFEGIVEGHIISHRRGTEGFGYDSVFIPLGETRTFAEMSLEEKNVLSHRGKAINALADFLRQHV